LVFEKDIELCWHVEGMEKDRIEGRRKDEGQGRAGHVEWS